LIKKGFFLALTGLLFFIADATSQCNSLLTNIAINFQTDKDCAPVTVTRFTVTYQFDTPQDPNTIEIYYDWWDPANSITVRSLATGDLTVSPDNMSFTADGTFVFNTNGGQCTLRPTVYLAINGTICTSSEQVQFARFWGTDEQSNGVVAMNPQDWEVCYDNPVINAVFSDASDFNCNVLVEQDRPNNRTRHVQFVYGTNHNPAATIRNLSLNDGAVQNLTDAAGNLSTTTTRGGVTGAYFGPIDVIPIPANGPIPSITFPMSAPANVLNAVGNRFEVTLYNWNICNPWNGSTVNPNYNQAVITRGYIIIVDGPAPIFVSEDNLGNATKDFCIGETIFFDNNTPNQGSYNYTWEFYDDATGVDLVGTSNQSNPNFSFSSGGTKLIRLIASNPTAQGTCEETFEDVVNITPSLVAAISVSDFTNAPISTTFCQETAAPFTNFGVRFRDVSSGTVTANTRWLWEFYDENNNLILRDPAAGVSSVALVGPYDRLFSNPGIYLARLTISDNVTGCSTEDEVEILVLNKPVPEFTFDRVCEGDSTAFADASSLVSINGHQIISWEWDMSYDGVTFTPDATLADLQNFNFLFPAAGAYDVALRVTTDQGTCSDIIVHTINVDPIPNAAFAADVISGCSVLSVTLTNNSIASQPDVIDEFIWEVDAGSGFQVDSIQRPTDPGFTNTYTRTFENFGTVNIQYNVRLRVVTQNGCEQISAPQTLTVFPGPRSGFISTNYNPFSDNCSPQTVNFVVDNQTQALNPSDYRWVVTDVSGILIDQSTGTTPSFSYQFVNSTQASRNYDVTLTTTLPSTCNRDSTRTIRINPIPVSDFVRDTLLFDCQNMNMRFDAQQKGLNEYTWTVVVNGVTIVNQTSSTDFLLQNFTRTGVQQNVDVSLQTRNFANCQSAITTQSFVVPVNDNITVAFTATPMNQALPNSTVTITNNTTPGPWQYDWDFGDGNTATGAAPPPHTYGTYGTFPITLTVTNSICVQTQTVTVTIDPIPPIIDFSYDPASGCSPLTVNFTNLSLFADTNTYQWSFGAGQGTSQAINPTYTYSTPGIYSVTLTANNILGQPVSETKLQIIEVFESPVAQFNIGPSVVHIPNANVYTNNRSTGGGSYFWDFGDGETSTDFEPIHTYTTEGTFDIMLVATNASGCTDTARLESVVMVDKAAQIIMPNAFTPSKDGPGGVGLNDVFHPVTSGITEFHMVIFNRWGQLLFESRSIEVGWDGYFNGKLCQQDVYVYKITAKDENGNVITRVGDIHLMR
jgi:gliding motility-associated-like protein